MKRHSWKKKINEKVKVKRKTMHAVLLYDSLETYECVDCGLRKGLIKNMKNIYGYRRFAYFTNSGKFLSFDRLPFPCNDIKFTFEEEDFLID
jgi:hypothetical protein